MSMRFVQALEGAVALSYPAFPGEGSKTYWKRQDEVVPPQRASLDALRMDKADLVAQRDKYSNGHVHVYLASMSFKDSNYSASLLLRGNSSLWY